MTDIIFNVWFYFYAYPMTYILTLFSNRIKDLSITTRGSTGLTIRELSIICSILFSLTFGIIIRFIYDCFLNDWVSYILLCLVVYKIGKRINDYVHPRIYDYIRFIVIKDSANATIDDHYEFLLDRFLYTNTLN